MSVIIGAKTIEQLDDNLAATELTLTPEEMAKLDEASALKSEYPGWMLARTGRWPRAGSEGEGVRISAARGPGGDLNRRGSHCARSNGA